jgi:hypothetical protein
MRFTLRSVKGWEVNWGKPRFGAKSKSLYEGEKKSHLFFCQFAPAESLTQRRPVASLIIIFSMSEPTTSNVAILPMNLPIRIALQNGHLVGSARILYSWK